MTTVGYGQEETGTVKDQSPLWTLRHLDQHIQKIWTRTLCQNEKDIFLTLKKGVHIVVGLLWHIRGTSDRLLLMKPGCVEIDTLYSLLPYYLTFSTLHSSAKGWQSQQLPPWVRTSLFKEHLVLTLVATKLLWNVVVVYVQYLRRELVKCVWSGCREDVFLQYL